MIAHDFLSHVGLAKYLKRLCFKRFHDFFQGDFGRMPHQNVTPLVSLKGSDNVCRPKALQSFFGVSKRVMFVLHNVFDRDRVLMGIVACHENQAEQPIFGFGGESHEALLSIEKYIKSDSFSPVWIFLKGEHLLIALRNS